MAKRKFKNKKTHPAKGLSKATKRRIVKRARAGKNVGEGNFGKIAAKGAKEYGSAEAGRRVAASIMWKLAKKRGVAKSGKIKKKKKGRKYKVLYRK